MLLTKKTKRSFFTYILVCTGVFGVCILAESIFVFEDGFGRANLQGFASTVSNTRFSETYEIFNQRYFTGFRRMFGPRSQLSSANIFGHLESENVAAAAPEQLQSNVTVMTTAAALEQLQSNVTVMTTAAALEQLQSNVAITIIAAAQEQLQSNVTVMITAAAPVEQNLTIPIKEDGVCVESAHDSERIGNSLFVKKSCVKNELLSSMPGGIFLPLKDASLKGLTDTDTNWFMSGLRGKQVAGEAESFDLPCDDPDGRILCVQGNDIRDGTRNSYGFFHVAALPPNSTFLNGTTFVNDNYWVYENLWHGMNSVVNIALWRKRNECTKPDRMLLYHWGELRNSSTDWLSNLLHATMGTEMAVLEPPPKSTVQGVATSESNAICFERAVVHRRGLVGMDAKVKRELFDMVRCKVRKYCRISVKDEVHRDRLANNSNNTLPAVRVTLLTRKGDRAFQNATAVAAVVQRECAMVGACLLKVVSINGLSFCEQAAVMSGTDVLISVHGAAMTNMIFMTPGSRVMELLPKGWLKYAGLGQQVFEWLSSWLGLFHEGNWEDAEGPPCPFPDIKGDRRCWKFFKNREVGLNATHLGEWTRNVLRKFVQDTEDRKKQNGRDAGSDENQKCACDADNVVYKDVNPNERIIASDLDSTNFMKDDAGLPLSNVSAVEKNVKNDLLRYMPGGIFKPLKDPRFPGLSDTDINWFMSGLRGRKERGGHPEAFDLPRDDPSDRILCLRGRSMGDGTKNSYGLFHPSALPPYATLLNGTTWVNENYWDYNNLWHGMGAVVNIGMWHTRNECIKPDRMVLYHQGELRNSSTKWLFSLLHAIVGSEMALLEPPSNESGPRGVATPGPVCFERAIVHRRGLQGMSSEVKRELFDTLRCRVRKYCGIDPDSNISGVEKTRTSPAVRLALLTRNGDRAFRNTSAVAEVVQGECDKVDGCHLEVVNFDGFSFCEQVGLLSGTDVVISVHGAQMTNIIFMSPGSRVMELLPKGWQKYAGVGYQVFQWISNWIGLVHEGHWEDSEGPDCPFPDNNGDTSCFKFFKNREVGLNATHLGEWTHKVLRNFVQDNTGLQKEDRQQNQQCACGAD